MIPFIHLTRFILKTVYFSPVNNPVFFCQLMVMGLFLSHASLRKHEAVLFLLLSAVSHRFMPAIRLNRSNTSVTQTGFLTMAMALLPLKKRTVLSAFLLAGILYVSLPLLLCWYAGSRFQNPPPVFSICPTRMNSITMPDGESLSFVEGIVVSGRSFRIPLNKSLLFGHLASEPVFSTEKTPDSVLWQVCPPTNVSPTQIFSGSAVYVQPEFHDPYLAGLPGSAARRMLLFTGFAFVFFLYDGIRMLLMRPLAGVTRYIGVGIDSVVTIMYLTLWCALLFDTLLPPTRIDWISSHVFFYGRFFPVIIATTGILCIIRTSMSIISLRGNGAGH